LWSLFLPNLCVSRLLVAPTPVPGPPTGFDTPVHHAQLRIGTGQSMRRIMMGFSVMNDEADEGDDLSYEVSDEAMEAAAGGSAQTITVFYLCAPPTSGQWCPA
jgi:hypothetical protein